GGNAGRRLVRIAVLRIARHATFLAIHGGLPVADVVASDALTRLLLLLLVILDAVDRRRGQVPHGIENVVLVHVLVASERSTEALAAVTSGVIAGLLQ